MKVYASLLGLTILFSCGSNPGSSNNGEPPTIPMQFWKINYETNVPPFDTGARYPRHVASVWATVEAFGNEVGTFTRLIRQRKPKFQDNTWTWFLDNTDNIKAGFENTFTVQLTAEKLQNDNYFWELKVLDGAEFHRNAILGFRYEYADWVAYSGIASGDASSGEITFTGLDSRHLKFRLKNKRIISDIVNADNEDFIRSEWSTDESGIVSTTFTINHRPFTFEGDNVTKRILPYSKFMEKVKLIESTKFPDGGQTIAVIDRNGMTTLELAWDNTGRGTWIGYEDDLEMEVCGLIPEL